jgi:hypothetical protein
MAVRNFMCPAMGGACEDARCKRGFCVREEADEVAARKAVNIGEERRKTAKVREIVNDLIKRSGAKLPRG